MRGIFFQKKICTFYLFYSNSDLLNLYYYILLYLVDYNINNNNYYI